MFGNAKYKIEDFGKRVPGNVRYLSDQILKVSNMGLMFGKQRSEHIGIFNSTKGTSKTCNCFFLWGGVGWDTQIWR